MKPRQKEKNGKKEKKTAEKETAARRFLFLGIGVCGDAGDALGDAFEKAPPNPLKTFKKGIVADGLFCLSVE